MRVILSLVFAVFSLSVAHAQQETPSPVVVLKAAMSAKDRGDWDGALALAQPGGFAAIDLIEWHRLRASQGSFDDTLNFLRRRPDWPGLPLLRKRSEVSIGPDAPTANVLSFFAAQEPQTAHGSLQLALALRKIGREAEAQAEARRGWRNLDASSEVEDAFIASFGGALNGDHDARLDMLLWSNERRSALRLLPLASPDHVKLAQARLAVQTNAQGLDVFLDQVPAALKGDPGLAFDRFERRIKSKRRGDAIALMLAQSTSPSALGRPAAWADARHDMARHLLWDGDHQRAYDVASSHFLADGADFAALEWLAGFLALRKLNRPDLALFHFQRHGTAVSSPISKGRTYYWQGRALEASGDTEGAQAAYRKGAVHQTAYYGLLSAEKAGSPLSGGCVKTPPRFPICDTISLLGMEVAHDAFHRRFGPPADDVAA